MARSKQYDPEIRSKGVLVKSAWRSGLFILLVIVFGYAAHLAHGRATRDQDGDVAFKAAPLRLNVYVANPAAIVKLAVESDPPLPKYPKARTIAKVLLSVSLPAGVDTDVLVTSDKEDAPGTVTNPHSARFSWAPHARTYFYRAKASQINELYKTGADLAVFRLGPDAYHYQVHPAALSVHLPGLGGLEIGDRGPQFFTTSGKATGLYPRTDKNCPLTASGAASCDYPTFSVPFTFQSSESLTGMQRIVNVADPIVDDPVAVLQANELSWTGTFGLVPVYDSIDRNSESDGRRLEFLSGVFVAIAGAALIALIQEGPDRWPTRRSRALARSSRALEKRRAQRIRRLRRRPSYRG